MFFTEFAEISDNKFMTLKGLEPATQPPLVSETSMLPQRHQDTCERQDLKIEHNSCFSDFTEFSESSVPFRKNSIVSSEL